jgi:hypothetical protein
MGIGEITAGGFKGLILQYTELVYADNIPYKGSVYNTYEKGGHVIKYLEEKQVKIENRPIWLVTYNNHSEAIAFADCLNLMCWVNNIQRAATVDNIQQDLPKINHQNTPQAAPLQNYQQQQAPQQYYASAPQNYPSTQTQQPVILNFPDANFQSLGNPGQVNSVQPNFQAIGFVQQNEPIQNGGNTCPSGQVWKPYPNGTGGACVPNCSGGDWHLYASGNYQWLCPTQGVSGLSGSGTGTTQGNGDLSGNNGSTQGNGGLPGGRN